MSGTSQCPSIATLTKISMVINVVTLLVLLPATIVLHRKLKLFYTNLQCQDPSQAGYDVTGPSDVTEPDDEGMKANDVNRYCYREDPQACVEQGKHVKFGEDGQSLCCGHLGSHLFEVMTEAVGKRLQADSSRGRVLQKIKQYIAELHRNSQTATFRPAAHVGILPNGSLTGPDDQVPRIQWDDSAEGSFLTGGIIHRGDRLTITKPGYYYVYSGLQYHVDPSKERSGSVVAYLYRTKGTEESRRKLMMSRESSCRWTRGDDGDAAAGGPVSLHMAGIFLLRRDDEISVRATSHSLLHRVPATTYLGIHMV